MYYTVNSKDLFQPKIKCQISPDPLRADKTLCGAISATAGAKTTPSETVTAQDVTLLLDRCFTTVDGTLVQYIERFSIECRQLSVFALVLI